MNEKARRATEAIQPGQMCTPETPGAVTSAVTSGVAGAVFSVTTPILRGKHETLPGDEVGESVAHWRRLLYVALGRWPFGRDLQDPRGALFGSLAVPETFAPDLMAALDTAGYETRLGDAYSDAARMLTFWRRA